MKKTLLAACLFAVGLTACGGGGGGDSAQPAAKSLKISMYGKPLVSSSSSAVARAQFSLITAAVAADAPNAASDAQVSVKSLTDALAERGVTSSITTQVVDGTALHQIVTTEYNGKAPTADQFKTDPSEWLIVNFQLDDMVTPASDDAQKAAIKQFTADLVVFSKWATVAGKAVFVVVPIPTCDTKYSASSGLQQALTDAFVDGGAPIRFIGQTGVGFLFDEGPVKAADSSPGLNHFGADCRSPDSYVQNLQVDSVADSIAAAYKESGSTSAASSTTAASAPTAAQ